MGDTWVMYSKEPYADTTWCKVLVQIRENATGEIVEFNDDNIFDTENNKVNIYIWEEGNYSCDCNRRLMFDENTDNETCGEGEYSVNILHPITRNVVYREF